MTRENIVELLAREPFLPFRLVLSSGDRYDILYPYAAALLKSEVFVVFPDGERRAHVPLLHIASIEFIRNGRPRRGGPQKRG